LREQGTHQLVVIAQQLNDVRKGAEQAFQHVCLTTLLINLLQDIGRTTQVD
jgi:hypothetical protein